MKSQKAYYAGAVGCLTLLACSFAVAGPIEGPTVRGEVSHAVSRPMRELSKSVHPQLAAATLAPTISQLLSIAGQSAPSGVLYSDATGAVGTGAIRSPNRVTGTRRPKFGEPTAAVI